MEEVENEAEHGRSEAVAEAADTRDHPLDQTLRNVTDIWCLTLSIAVSGLGQYRTVVTEVG